MARVVMATLEGEGRNSGNSGDNSHNKFLVVVVIIAVCSWKK